MGLEEAFYGSTAIRNFLKLFSQQHEKRVSKATFLIGITRLAEIAEKKGRQSIASLTVDDIEKLALKVHERYARNKREKTAGDNIAPVYQNLETSVVLVTDERLKFLQCIDSVPVDSEVKISLNG